MCDRRQGVEEARQCVAGRPRRAGSAPPAASTAESHAPLHAGPDRGTQPCGWYVAQARASCFGLEGAGELQEEEEAWQGGQTSSRLVSWRESRCRATPNGQEELRCPGCSHGVGLVGGEAEAGTREAREEALATQALDSWHMATPRLEAIVEGFAWLLALGVALFSCFVLAVGALVRAPLAVSGRWWQVPPRLPSLGLSGLDGFCGVRPGALRLISLAIGELSPSTSARLRSVVVALAAAPVTAGPGSVLGPSLVRCCASRSLDGSSLVGVSRSRLSVHTLLARGAAPGCVELAVYACIDSGVLLLASPLSLLLARLGLGGKCGRVRLYLPPWYSLARPVAVDTALLGAPLMR